MLALRPALIQMKGGMMVLSVPLPKLINQSDMDNFTFTERTFYIRSEQHDQLKATEPEQFSRFITFIKSTTDPTCKAEMSMFLYPVFIHFYLNMLERSFTEEAFIFAEKYRHLFTKDAKHSQVVDELVNMKHHRDIGRSQKITYFRENRYSLKISEDTYSTLESFFSQEINFPFLELIQGTINLTISYSKELDSGAEVEHDRDAVNGSKDQKDSSGEFKVNYDAIPEYRKYLSAKKCLQNVPPNPQSLMCWTIHNLEEASCAEINSDANLMLTASLSGKILISKIVSPMINDIMTVPINSVPLANPGLEPATVRHMKRTDRMYMNVYGNKGAVHDVSFVPDSKLFLSVSSDNYMRAYSLDTYNCVMKYRWAYSLDTYNCVMKYSGHDMSVWSVAACNKGLALTGSQDTTARLWSLEHMHPLRLFVGHKQDVTCARFHPRLTYVGTGSQDKVVRLWSIVDGASVRVLSDHESPVLSLAFSPCHKFLASGGEDGLVLTHELTTGRVLSRFHLAGLEPVTSLAWSSTGETLVAGSAGGTVQMNSWPSVPKIGAQDCSTTVVYHNAMPRILNIQYKSSPPGPPICLGVAKEPEQDTFIKKEGTSMSS